MHSRCCRTVAGNIVTGIINKPLLLHLVCCLHYLYQWCTVKQVSDNEIYLLTKYIKSVLWRVAKRLSYTEDARCLKFNENMRDSESIASNIWMLASTEFERMWKENFMSSFKTLASYLLDGTDSDPIRLSQHSRRRMFWPRSKTVQFRIKIRNFTASNNKVIPVVKYHLMSRGKR